MKIILINNNIREEISIERLSRIIDYFCQGWSKYKSIHFNPITIESEGLEVVVEEYKI